MQFEAFARLNKRRSGSRGGTESVWSM